MSWETVLSSETIHSERLDAISLVTFYFQTSNTGGYFVRCLVTPCGCYKTLHYIHAITKVNDSF